MQSRVCTKCEKEKDLTEFYKGNGKYGKASQCKKCRNARSKAWRIKNRERRNQLSREWSRSDKGRDSHLKYKYGISLSDYNKMFVKQNGCCNICGKHQSEMKKALNVDHNHATGKVRGLLCIKCNVGVGAFKDSQELLLRAVDYLGGV